MKEVEQVILNLEAKFGISELFFSTTNEKGIIQSGNNVFFRVSAYEENELIQAPHSIIRHPDMPRAVFKLLWDYIQNGKSIAAYVKNLARDGKYYWVVAFVLPIPNGYLSIRFKPSSQILEQVRNVYQEMRRIEIEQGDRGESRKRGIILATEHLLSRLQTLGHSDYDAFMRTMLKEELKSRDAMCSANGFSVVPPFIVVEEKKSSKLQNGLYSLYNHCEELFSKIEKLYNQLDLFVNFVSTLSQKSNFLLELSQNFGLISLNTAIRSTQLGQQGASLSVVANHMASSSQDIQNTVKDLTNKIVEVTQHFRKSIFTLAGAKLQLEMIMTFCEELNSKLYSDNSSELQAMNHKFFEMINALKHGFDTTCSTAIDSLVAAQSISNSLALYAEDLRKIVISLNFIQLSGIVEASRVDDGGTFKANFSEVRSQIDQGRQELDGLLDTIFNIQTEMHDTPAIAKQVQRKFSEIQKVVGTLAA